MARKNGTPDKTKEREEAIKQSGLVPDALPLSTIKKLIDGRPSKYTKDLCYKVILLMAEGNSQNSTLIELGINERTFHDWMNEYITAKKGDRGAVQEMDDHGKIIYKKLNTNYKPDFLKAVKIGQKLCLRWWETMGKVNLQNKDFNNTMYMMQMQNRFGWSRRLDGNINITETHKEIKEIVFKFETEEIKEYVEELKELGIKFDSPGILETTAAEVH